MTEIRAWLRQVGAVLAKEWRCELRTRYAVSSVLLFACTTLFVISLAIGPIGGSSELQPIMPVLLWVILLFATSAGLPRTFVHEEEMGTADALRLSAEPSAVLCGKMLYNLALVLLLEAVVTPLFMVLVHVDVAAPADLTMVLIAGAIGLGAGSTLIAAIVSQAQARGTLFAVLAFPILLPLLKLVIEASFSAILGEPGGMALQLAFLYDGVLIVVSLMLFPLIWSP